MNILVPNLGSTSLKYKLFESASETVLARGKVERIGSQTSIISTFDGGDVHQTTLPIASHSEALLYLIQNWHNLISSGHDGTVDAIALKAVHAGPKYCGSFLVDDDVLESMEQFLPVAPLHNAIYLNAIRSFRSTLPGIPIVASFETGFHSSMPEYAQTYGIPYEWTQRFGIRRYGFHGASHSYIAARVPELLKKEAIGLRIISCHLGGSSSICAICDGRSLDCSFGFSPQSGIDHATRSGDLDPFVVRFVALQLGESDDEVLASLAVNGGLLGISGVSCDCRDLEAASADGNLRARLALDVFIYTVRKYIGAFFAVLGGVDVLVFTGGIGENSAFIRKQTCQGLEHLGIAIDASLNHTVRDEVREISASSSIARVLVVPADEELMVARGAARILADRPALV